MHTPFLWYNPLGNALFEKNLKTLGCTVDRECSDGGLYLTLVRVRNIPPWSDFQNLARFSKSVPYVLHMGVYMNISHPTPHSRLLILFETSICPSATPTTTRRRRHSGRQQRYGEKAARRMTTRRKSTVVSDCKNLFVRQSEAQQMLLLPQLSSSVGGGGGGQHQEESAEGWQQQKEPWDQVSGCKNLFVCSLEEQRQRDK